MIGGEYMTEDVELTWTNVPVSSSDVAPDNDIRVPIVQAKTIAIQLEISGSTNIDMELFSSIDGTKWDTSPYYAETGLGVGTITLNVPPGPRYLRARVNNNDADNAGNIVAKMLIRK